MTLIAWIGYDLLSLADLCRLGLFTKFKMCCSSDYTAIAESGNACALKLVNHFNAETSDIASNRLMSFCNRAVNVEVFLWRFNVDVW